MHAQTILNIIIIACLCSSSLEAGQLDESSLVQSASGELSAQDRELLKAYHHSFDDEKVDLDLIMHLLFNICQSSDEGERQKEAQEDIQFKISAC